MRSLYQNPTTVAAAAAQRPAEGPLGAAPRDSGPTGPSGDTIDPLEAKDAYRDVQVAVQQALAANWDANLPRVAVVERNGIDTAFVSTVTRLSAQARTDIRGAVRAALAPYARLAPFTQVVFLTRGTL